jgi:predicted nuclease of restriction endonuclease-like (RecB) superfamily
MKKITISSYERLVTEVKERLLKAQHAALQKVNTELISLYWDLGKIISQAQIKKGWGDSVVETLANDLQTELSGVSGFSVRNLYLMRDFFNTYNNNEFLQPLVAEIGWSHNIVILQACKIPEEREFYIRMTKKFGWSKNVLKLQIQNNAFMKAAKGQQNFNKSLPSEKAAQALLALKDEYTFDFLELASEHNERELESALVARIGKFLSEMGGRFTFVGNQYRITVGGEDFYIDLLLYHRGLQCLVAIELKVVDFKPEFAGKMQFYLTALNKQEKMPHENPAIGIILCKGKNRTIVEYALADARHPLGVASYTISNSLPKELRGSLPSPDEMAKLLDSLRAINSIETKNSEKISKLKTAHTPKVKMANSMKKNTVLKKKTTLKGRQK